jgi:threonine dehydrogenase-like Zn-dependent dehydrogenase
MRAAVFKGQRRIEIEGRPIPEPAAGEVQVRIKAVGVCGSDLHGFEGKSGRRRLPGLVMGHEAAGVISAVGKDPGNWEVGDRVFLNPMIACGRCSFCRRGWRHLCENKLIIGSSMIEFKDGALCDYLTIPVGQLHRIPDSVTYAEASFGEPASCAVHVFNRSANEVNDSIAVIGTGAIGLVAVQAARHIGAGVLIAVDIAPGRLELARKFGADFTIDSRNLDPVEEIQKYTDGRGVDIAVEAVGSTITYTQCAHALRKRGTLLALGFMEDEICFPIQPILFRELAILGCTGFTHEIDTVLSMMAVGTLDVKSLITHRFALEETQAAFETAADAKARAIKVVVEL